MKAPIVKRSPSMQQLEADESDLEEGRTPAQAAPKGSPLASRTAVTKAFVDKWARALLLVVGIYVCLLGMLALLLRRLPTRGALSEKAHLPQDTELLMKLPHNITELRAVRMTLELYRENYSMQVASLLVVTYLVLQALSIPGTICINLLIGSMYSFPLALLTVAVISTAGACLNYELSALLVRDMIVDLMPGRIGAFQRSIQRQQDAGHLLNFFVVLRVTPLLPSWFINFASPIAGVPFQVFALGSFIGLQPLNFISVSAGRTLGRLNSYSDLYGPKTLVTMLVCAAVALLPVALKRWLARRPNGSSIV